MNAFFRSTTWRLLLMPLLISLSALFGSAAVALIPIWLAAIFALVFGLGLLFFLVSAIRWFIQKKVKRGLAALGCLLCCLLALVPAGMAMFFGSMLAEDLDNFANELTLPENVVLLDPTSQPPHPSEPDWTEPDSFQAALIATLETTGTSDAAFLPSIPALGILHRDYPELLNWYLSASPAWWRHQMDGKEFATRRWLLKEEWQTRNHGYFSSFHPPESQNYQTRTCIGLSGKTWSWRADPVPSGKELILPIKQGYKLKESYVVWQEQGVTVEIMEQAETEERRMSKAAVRELQVEFEALLKDPTLESARALLPTGAIIRGEPSISLAGGSGRYTAVIRGNPGAPGNLYLKAYEITGKVPLSKSRLKQSSAEFIGWSDDPDELFRASFDFSIYEGDWNQYYGARFEVWFSPEHGGSDRKLMESNWKIDGWSR